MRSEAAYGFVLSPKDEKEKRNILTHAEQHLGCQWLYNVDVEDFFHFVTSEMVYQVFAGPIFNFKEELAELFTRLCTNQGRLPMGAPTSPVLSNFATLEMDRDLLDYAEWAGWIYTRFADDMSFSAQREMKTDQLDRVESIVKEHGFIYNPKKIKLMKPEDEKVVTGLILKEKVELPEGFMDQLHEEIVKLGHVLEAQYWSGRKSEWVEEYGQRIEGMLVFASFVLGANDPEIVKAEEALWEVQQPKEAYFDSWLNFGYVDPELYK